MKKADFSKFNPKQYLEHYYSRIDSENQNLLEFLVKAYLDINPNSTLLEFGGGPTIYPLIPAAPKVKKIHFTDFLKTNLQEIELWKENSPKAHNWKRFIVKTLQLEGLTKVQDKNIDERESQIRKKISRIFSCNAYKKNPLGPKYSHYYDVVNINFVLESITSSLETWEQIFNNVCSLLKLRGVLILTAIGGAGYYKVNEETFPAVPITEKEIIKMLVKNGFKRSNIIIQSIPAEVIDENSNEFTGYKSMIFVKATR